ncbi:MAG TPA: enoyl-CoA hydratase/isomerase family protein [Candidatus Nitrosotenuis sp.]|nr:enoyl-CoA hydratase/isomerase family protein [Candidatus Nitrosotenuis sp.]
MTSEPRRVELEVQGPVTRLVLASPPLNILDIEMLREMRRALEQAVRPDLKVLVVESRLSAFSAGADVAEHMPAAVREMLESFHAVIEALLEFPRPTLAAVRGAALGGGCELALACDFLLMSRKARLGQPEIRLGVFPPVACLLLPDRVPGAVAREMILTGEPLSAERALALGLANRVAEEALFAEEVEKFLGLLTRLSGPALGVARRAANLGADWKSRLRQLEKLYLEELMALPDPVEGILAFLEKRPPRWAEAESSGAR